MTKGVALASAAAIAAATPAIMPALDVPTHALATAEVQLANNADVLSVPAEVWTDILFNNTQWGGYLSAESYGPEWAAPQTVALQYGYVNPWAAYCNGECVLGGISGVAYLFLDALINGNGAGLVCGCIGDELAIFNQRGAVPDEHCATIAASPVVLEDAVADGR